jgi:UPF0755 protein
MMARRNRGSGRLVRAGLALAVVLVALWGWREIAGSGTAAANVRVTIPKGVTVRAAAESLSSAQVISSARLFRWYVSIRGRERDIKPGTYAFAEQQGYASVLDALVSGRGITHAVVIPEGFDLREITPALVKALGVPEDSVRAAVSDTAWRRRLNVPAPTLEGYLFPATYSFAEGTTAREAVETMLERFESVWKPEWDVRLQAMAISRNDAMAMASIVEKEARKAEERPIIAAVYWNRVKKGMRLQADPTVQYALPAHVDRVFFKDLEVDSKYNTYKYAGLPPGPIASPGEASIVAALTPANVPYLYFVAHPDGHHEFRTTFAEHERAIVAVKRAARQATPDGAPVRRRP